MLAYKELGMSVARPDTKGKPNLVLDLVQPRVAGWRLRRFRGKAGRNETGREGMVPGYRAPDAWTDFEWISLARAFASHASDFHVHVVADAFDRFQV